MFDPQTLMAVSGVASQALGATKGASNSESFRADTDTSVTQVFDTSGWTLAFGGDAPAKKAASLTDWLTPDVLALGVSLAVLFLMLKKRGA